MNPPPDPPCKDRNYRYQWNDLKQRLRHDIEKIRVQNYHPLALLGQERLGRVGSWGCTYVDIHRLWVLHS